MITGDSLEEIYPKILTKIISEGIEVSPRLLPTIEIHPEIICLNNPNNRIITNPFRRINPGFLCAEMLWILSGSCSPWIFDFNSKLLQFTDHGTLHGAYGPRLRSWKGEIDQFAKVCEKLEADPTSRQATMVIFDPSTDFLNKKDIPCTNMFRFLIREQHLDMTTIMRSQDAWLGLPYDIFNFTVIQEVLAGFLDVSVGKYYHFVDSLHLYKNDLDKARMLVDHTRNIQVAKPCLTSKLDWLTFDSFLEFIIKNAIEHPNEEKIELIQSDFWRSVGFGLIAYRKQKVNIEKSKHTVSKIEDPSLHKTFKFWIDSKK